MPNDQEKQKQQPTQTATVTVGAKHQPSQIPKLGKPPLRTVVLLFIAIASGFFGGWLEARHNQVSSLTSSSRQQIVLNESQLISDIAKDVGPGVVSVNATSQTTQSDAFGFSQPVQQEGAGTGFIISSDGIVVTNRHVVPAGSTNISITLSD